VNDLISVIIPVYNVEKYLLRCLSSVSSQTYKNIEILAVNDGSKDNSINILSEYLKKDNRLVIIDQKNQGLSGARNSAIKIAKGKYLIFLDSDDYIKEELIEEVYENILKESADIAVYGYDKIKEDGTLIAKPDFGNNIFEHDEAIKKILSLAISPMACNKMYKKSLFIENNIFYPLRKLHEDVGTTYKLFWNAKKIISMSKSYYYWIIRDGSITSKTTYKHVNDIFELFHEKKYFLENQNIFDDFQESYEVGFIKMINLLFERLMTDEAGMKHILPYLVQRVNELNIINQDNEFYNKMKSFITEFQSIFDKVEQLKKEINVNNELIKKQKIAIESRDKAMMKKDEFIKKLYDMIDYRNKKIESCVSEICLLENSIYTKIFKIYKNDFISLKKRLLK